MLKNIRYPFFKIKKEKGISGEDLINLRKFYTPILSTNAILLYEYLRDLSYDVINEKGMYDYESLTYLLGMNLEALNDARIKLESLSLLSTFIDEINHATIFLMEKPLDAITFKKNVLLSNKLSKIIGKKRFEHLLGENKVSLKMTNSHYLENVSAKYNDVFDENEELACLKEVLQEAKEVDHSLLGDTTEINLDIQEKLDLKNFEYDNPYEAILKTDSRYFFSQISYQIPTEGIIELIKEARQAGMIDPCINLVFFYAQEVNGKINLNYVKKIILDLIKKEVISFIALEKHLDIIMKDKNKTAVSKKDLYKLSYFENLQKSNILGDN